jgi:hypothetical protein
MLCKTFSLSVVFCPVAKQRRSNNNLYKNSVFRVFLYTLCCSTSQNLETFSVVGSCYAHRLRIPAIPTAFECKYQPNHLYLQASGHQEI